MSRTYRIPVQAISPAYGTVNCGSAGYLSCETNGDKLSDTEADPQLSNVYTDPRYVDPYNGCTYNSSTIGTDVLGATWQPDVRNIMSYAPHQCRDRFSLGQVGVMYYWIDQIGYNNPAFYISGSSILCTNQAQSFTFYGVSGTATYTWQVPSGWSLSGQGGKTVSISAPDNNGGTIVVSPSCGVPTSTSTYQVAQVVDQISIYGIPAICPNRYAQFSVQNVPGVYFTWSYSGAGQIWSGQGTSTLTIQTGSNFQGGQLTVTATNPCTGSAYYATRTLSKLSSCGGGRVAAQESRSADSTAYKVDLARTTSSEHLAVYPNPADQYIKVVVSGATNKHFDIKVFSVSGHLKLTSKTTSLSEGSILDVSKLTAGIYLIDVRSETSHHVQRLVIK